AGKKSAQIREILISESAWEEMTCLFAPSLTTCFAGEKHLSLAPVWIVKRGDPKRQLTAKWMRYKTRKPYVTYRYAGLY
ncbi:hypothetical protein L1Q52_14545, partial [Klebsiella pneumoniae]